MPLVKKNMSINRRMWLVTILTLGLIWAAIVGFFTMYQAEIIEAKRQELVQMNNVVAQHTVALLRSVETDLMVIAWQLQGGQHRNPLYDPFFIEMTRRLKDNADGLVDFRLVADDGKGYAIPPLRDRPFARVDDLEYYREAMARPDGTEKISLGRPIVARLTGRWVIPVSLRLPPSVPHFRLVVASIDMERLLAVQKAWLISKHGSIVLMRDDAAVLSRAPFLKSLLGVRLTGSRLFSQRASQPSGSYFSDSPHSDGARRFVSYLYLDEFRLFVTVTRGYDDALAQFYTMRRDVLLCTVFVSLCLLFAAFANYRAQSALLDIQLGYQRQALMDDLTRVMNRRALMHRAREMWGQVNRQPDGRLAVLMIDIDFFKKVNDRFGHAAGDAVLKSATELWRGALRRQDLLGRLGGEEFAIVMPEVTPAMALEIAERLRTLTAERITAGPEREPCSISIGIAMSQSPQDQVADMLKRADLALYRAKQAGRNRVALYPDTAAGG